MPRLDIEKAAEYNFAVVKTAWSRERSTGQKGTIMAEKKILTRSGYEKLENELNDFYRNEERRSYVNVGSRSVFSSPSETDLETETEKKVEIAMRTIRKFIDSDHSFRLYLAPTKGGGRRSPDSWILLGETTFSAASEPVTETKRRR